jgi:hypothetical protein
MTKAARTQAFPKSATTRKCQESITRAFSPSSCSSWLWVPTSPHTYRIWVAEVMPTLSTHKLQCRAAAKACSRVAALLRDQLDQLASRVVRFEGWMPATASGGGVDASIGRALWDRSGTGLTGRRPQRSTGTPTGTILYHKLPGRQVRGRWAAAQGRATGGAPPQRPSQ